MLRFAHLDETITVGDCEASPLLRELYETRLMLGAPHFRIEGQNCLTPDRRLRPLEPEKGDRIMKQVVQTIVAVSLAALCQFAAAQTATTFTYQGQLRSGGDPLNGTADLRFSLYDAAAGGNRIGLTQTVANVAVSDGLVNVELDFGAAAFDGGPRWLSIEVRSPAGGGPYTTLSPRQPVTPAPYSIQTRGILVDETGNVGIGTTAPSSKVTIAGENNHGGDSASIVLQNTTGGTGRSFLLGSAHEGLFQIADMTANATSRLVIDDAGRVGIGTINPITMLHAAGELWLTNGNGGGLSGAGAGLRLYFDENLNRAHIFAWDYSARQPRNLLLQEPGGAVGVGTDTPVEELHVKGNGGVLALEGSTHAYIEYYPDLVSGGRKAFVGFQNATDNDFTIRNEISGNDINLVTTGGGVTRVSILEITGADLAEKFPTSESAAVEPGTVMVIDAANAGKLRVSSSPYDRCVAGVVSGANDFSVGAVLGNLPGHEDAPAIALSGRVYVRCDATAAAIQPGDLLTTSDAPGCAMKVLDHGRAQGAIIGKAMTSLEQGDTGLVLVLVTLQ